MSYSYRVIFKPIEPFFFGEEKGFDFENPSEQAKYQVDKNNYFIRSGSLPSQSTIIGTIRFLVLRGSGVEPDGNGLYIGPDIIGRQSFSLEGDNGFEKIQKIGSVHLFDGSKEYYRIPFSAKRTDRRTQYDFCGIRMEECGNFKGHDFIMPADEEYDSKIGMPCGWMDVAGNCIEDSDVFGSVEKTRILKQYDEGTDNDFFKKEYKFFKDKEWSFCCTLTMDMQDDVLSNKSMIVQMGQEKSSFIACFLPIEYPIEEKNEEFKKRIMDEMSECLPAGYSMRYAASDIFFKEEYDDSVAFAMVTQKCFRYMTTSIDAGSYYERLKKSKLYYLINAGSVFFVKNDSGKKLESCFGGTELCKWGFNLVW